MNLENKKLNEVLGYEQPTKYIVETTDYDDSFETPVLTAGKSFLLGYTNEKNGVFTNVPAIIFDDFTTSFHYVDFPFKVKSSAMKILTPKADYVDLKYVYLQMKQVKIDTQLHKRYWISRFSNKEIPFPEVDIQNKSSETQQRIAEILDNAAALRDKTAQLLKEYDLLAQSIFLDMFGEYSSFDFYPIRTVSDFIDYRGKTPERVDKGVPLISAKCVRQGYFDENRLDYIEESNYEKIMVRGFPKSGDVLFTTEGATLGFTCRIPNIFSKFSVGQRIITLQAKSKTNNTYLEYILRSNQIQGEIYKKATGSAAKGIRSAVFAKIEIPIPPIKLQNQFAEKIGLIEQQKALAKQELKEAEDLFNCLLQKAFKGELV